MTRNQTFAIATAVVLASFACRDTTGLETRAVAPPAIDPGQAGPRVVATFTCTAQRGTAELACVDAPRAGRATGPRFALLGQNQVKLRSSNVVYDSVAQLFAFDVTVQNLLTVPIGTPDGVTVEGSKAYFETGPTVTAYRAPGDTGVVTVVNADGHADYTYAQQPYFHYPVILQPQQVSAVKRWHLHMGPQVQSFVFTLRVFTSIPAPTEVRVPISPPDTVPATLYTNPANVIENSPYFHLAPRVLKGIVSLRFKPTANREERQAAIDQVNGKLIGGHALPGAEGYYLVRVPDDSVGYKLSLVVDSLNKLPQVSTAAPEYLWNPQDFKTSIQPDDSGDWRKPWQTRSSLADGDNWALEAISAPLAWGCTTGSFTTKVGVVDIGFFSNADLTVNTVYAPALDKYDGYAAEKGHGTSTATALAARGNNGAGISGVMWNASVSLYDVSISDDGTKNYSLFSGGGPIKHLTEKRIVEAINAGAHVVNVSLAVPGGAGTPERGRELERMARDLATTIQSLPNKPLIVIGAGNSGDDAYWSGLPILAALLPDQVLVVAGVSEVGDGTAQTWLDSSRNTGAGLPYTNLVQIAAPATDVGGIAKDGVGTFDGTSMSAPLVAGIAGLLKSFDPRLTAPEIKALLLEGARRSGRLLPMPGNVWVANAYESLTAAGERPGAPVCGGVPVWQDPGGLVFARRVAGINVGALETFFQQGGVDLAPMHGETTIRVDQNFWGWSNGAWFPAVARTDPFTNATTQSRLGRTHDGDKVVTVSRVEVDNLNETYKVFVNGTLLADVPSLYAKQPAVQACVHWTSGMASCLEQVSSWYNRVTTTPAVAFSPDGSEVVLAISKQQSTYRTETPYSCGAEYCADHGLDIRTLTAELVFINTQTGQMVRQNGPIRSIAKLGYSEDGLRLVLQQSFAFYTSTYSGSDFSQTSTNYCDGQYNTRSGTRLFNMPLKLNTANCYANATFSP